MAGIKIFPREYQGIEKEAMGNYLISDGRYKYIYSVPDGKEFFFDHHCDPLETRNKIGVQMYSDSINRLKGSLIKFLSDNGIKGIIEGNNWKPLPPVAFHSSGDAGLLVQDISAPWFDEKSTLKGYLVPLERGC
jgi:hypothetical protein